MTKASDNPYPSLLLVEGTEPAAPSAGQQRLYIDSTTHHLTRTDSSGSEVDLESAAGGAGALTNRVLGKSYTLTNAPNASYPDAASVQYFDGTGWNGRKLTDGVSGGGYTSGQNVGWSSGNGIIKFDLTTAANVEKVICRGRFGTGGVYRPISFLVEYSDDDVTYTTAFSVTGLAEGGQPGDEDWRADLPFTGSTHRYWRVTIGRTATAGGFLFVNEVELWG